MVGAAPDGSQKVTMSTWKQFENCTISQIRLVENGTEIKCKETLNYSHAGPQIKGGYLFKGAPVNLVNSLSQHVEVVGMEDATGALKEQHWSRCQYLHQETLRRLQRTNNCRYHG